MIKPGLPPQKAPEPIPSSPQQPPMSMQQLAQAPPQQPQQGQPAPQAPGGGPDKWAADGFHVLKQHVDDENRQWLEDHKETLMLDPKLKHLLVTSSSFQPGSKPLDDIVGHLKARLEKVMS